MRLTGARIDGFGCICNSEFKFDRNLNSIIRENGWGKSTLAAFVRVMLFGFKNENVKKDAQLEKERLRFKPWQSGAQYGGTLCFSCNDRDYILSRSFGSKPKDDVFELRDAKTNLKSTDYSEDIGREMFQVDCDSFERTVYVSQNDCRTAANAVIQAKIGNLAEHTDDMNNADSAIDSIKNLLNGLSPKRSTGELSRLDGHIRELEQAVRAKAAVTDGEKELALQLSGLLERQKEFGTFKIRLHEIRAELGIRKLSEEEELELEKLSQDEKSGLFDESIGQRAGKLTEELNEARQAAAAQELSNIEKTRLEELGGTFRRRVPSRKEMEEMLDIWDESDTLEKECARLEAELKHCKRDAQEDCRRRAGKAGAARLWVLAMSGVLLAAFVITGILIHPAALGAVAVPVVTAVYALIKFKPGRELETWSEPFEKAYYSLEKQLADTEKECLEGRESVREFIAEFGMRAKDSAVPARLYDLTHLAAEYTRLTEQRDRSKADGALERVHAAEDNIRAFTAEYGCLCGYRGDRVPELLEALRRREDKYRLLREKNESYNACRAESEKLLNTIKRELDMVDTFAEEESVSDSVFVRAEKLSDRMNALDRHMGEIKKELAAAREELSVIGEKEQELEELRRQRAEKYKKFCLLEKTGELLSESRERFTAGYMEPIMSSFKRRMSAVDELMSADSNIDAAANISITKCGLQRDYRLFSTGLRDLVGICLRLAFVDVMYTKEKPFLIMDDPFVNLDDERRARAERLLESMAAEYQILYFSCREI